MTNLERPFTAEEASAYLRISVRSLRRTVSEGFLAFTKLPHGAMTFAKADLDGLLQRFRREAADPQASTVGPRRVDEAAIVTQAVNRVGARRRALRQGNREQGRE